jgi:thiamine-monophosphate kinase
MLVEGVHYLPDDPPDSVAAKLLAVNLSDLAAKGARPIGALMGYALVGDAAWDAAFLRGLKQGLAHYDLALLGGDTVQASQRIIGLTLIGEAEAAVPSRSGARPGDALFVTGTIGDAGLGLELARAGLETPAALVRAYRKPEPQMLAGRGLAPIVSAMMDVSDGLLIDATRMAEASGIGFAIDLDSVPLSPDSVALAGQGRDARIAAVTAGDDYQLLFTCASRLPPMPCRVTRIGQAVAGSGLQLRDAQGIVELPPRLGWLHATN